MPADPAQAASSSGGDLPPIMDPEAVVAEAVAEERPKRMARPTLVCAACKRLKLKCDRREPCEMCAKHKRVHECTYSQPLKE